MKLALTVLSIFRSFLTGFLESKVEIVYATQRSVLHVGFLTFMFAGVDMLMLARMFMLMLRSYV